MKGFNKLALASAIAALPAGAVALEPLNDSEMSGVTGQDGININLEMDLNVDMIWEDTTGVPDQTTGGGTVVWDGLDNAGALAIENIAMTGQEIDINLDVGSEDPGDPGADTGVLQIGVSLGDITLDPGIELSVGATGAAANNYDVTTTTAGGSSEAVNRVTDDTTYGDAIVSLGQIDIGGMDLFVQLGDDAQNFLYIAQDDPFDIAIQNFALTDLSTDEDVSMDLFIGNIDLDGTTASVTQDGLEIEVGGVGSGGQEVAMGGLTFGSTPAIGNVYLSGMDISGTTVTVSGTN